MLVQMYYNNRYIYKTFITRGENYVLHRNDIGSTSAKVVVFNEDKLEKNFVLPTGWSSVETANTIRERLNLFGVNQGNSKVVATGYGRVSVPYADKTITEIT